jgi:hypothetical protein
MSIARPTRSLGELAVGLLASAGAVVFVTAYVKRLLLFEPGVILASVPYQLLR